MGPGGIAVGSYDATQLSQDQRQWLWEQFGHAGQAPLGYGGEGSSGGGAQSSEEMAKATVQASMDAYNQLAQQQWSKMSEYDKKYAETHGGAFDFDKLLEGEYAKVQERLDPYYKQTLNDYLTGYNAKKQRSLEDERTLLTSVQQDIDSYTEQEKIALAETLDQVRQGKADAGLYFSGARQRAEGLTVGTQQRQLSDYLRGQGEKVQVAKTTTQRGLEDLQLEKNLQEREYGKIDPLTGNWLTNPATNKPWRGVQEEYETRSQGLSEAQRKQGLYQYEKNLYAGTPPGVDIATWASKNTNLLTGT